MFKIVF